MQRDPVHLQPGKDPSNEPTRPWRGSRGGPWWLFDQWPRLGARHRLQCRCSDDILSNRCKDPTKVLAHLGPCLEQRRHGWSPWERSQDPVEEIIRHDCREVGETLLRSLRLCQFPHECPHCQSYPSLHPWISHSDEQQEQPPPAVGGQRSRHRPLPTVLQPTYLTLPPLHELDHDTDRLGSRSEPCELLL
jgi:hypothetical protein